MPYIRFSIQIDTEDEEPSRVIRKIDGTVFEYAEESDKEEQIGTLECFLVQPGLAAEKEVSLFDAMDSISDATMECYEALFDPDTDEWSDSVEELYSGGPISPDLLFIDRVELDERHRGKGIGRDVVKGIIETFGLHCGLIVCKPFALQYEGWAETYSAAEQADSGFEKRKADAFGRVAKFWMECGFVQLPDSEFYAYSPELLKQPDPSAPKASPVRVPRGRRRMKQNVRR
jgi:GNAT superfamily N-acetyltransferase